MGKAKAADAKTAKAAKTETDEPKKKKRHWIRWTVLSFLAAVILLIVFAPSIVSTPWGNDIVRGIIADQLKRPVTLEKLELGWFSGIEIRNLQIDRLDGKGHFVKLERFSSGIGWLPLMAQQLRAGEGKIEIDIGISLGQDDKLNIDDLIGADPAAPAASGGDGGQSAGDAPPAEAPPTEDGGDGGLHWITNGYVNAVLTNSKVTYKDEKARTSIVISDIHIPIELSKELVISGASMKINDGPVEIESIVFGLVGDQARIKVKLKASNITVTAAPPPIEPPAFIKPLLRIRDSIPLLHSEDEDVVGGTIELLEVDIQGKGSKNAPGGFELAGTIHAKVSGGRITAKNPIARLLFDLLGWNSLDAVKIDTGIIRIEADGKVNIEERITITCPQADIIITGSSQLGGELDYRMVLNPKVGIPGDRKSKLAKMNSLLRAGVLAFKIVGPENDPKVLPDPAGAAKNVFFSIFGKPTHNPFVRDGSVLQRLWDLRPRLPGTGEQAETKPAGPPNPLDLFRRLPKPPLPGLPRLPGLPGRRKPEGEGG